MNGYLPVLRRLRADEAATLYRFYSGLSSQTLLLFRPLGWSPSLDLCESVCRDQQSGKRIDYVYEVEGEIVGWGFLCRWDTPDLDLGIGLADAWQGCGLGRPLMETLVNAAQAAGKRSIGLIVVQENLRAQALYASLGFVCTGSHRGHDQQDYFRMHLQLEAP